MNNTQIDGGDKFGKWDDPVSQFMYFKCMPDIIKKIPDECLIGKIGDFGGGNGLIKEFWPGAISIDNDPKKKPDILCDILYHVERYHLAVIRYVLHYLTDKEVIQLFETINAKHILVIQFVNPNLVHKYKNSIYEIKHFRTPEQLESLMPSPVVIYEKEYTVTPEFYANRLRLAGAFSHSETIKAYLI